MLLMVVWEEAEISVRKSLAARLGWGVEISMIIGLELIINIGVPITTMGVTMGTVRIEPTEMDSLWWRCPVS
jgi:hypothetical protein